MRLLKGALFRALLAAASILLLSGLAIAAGTKPGLEVFSGFNIDTEGQGFYSLGGAADLNISGGWAFTLKTLASHLTYEYESGGVRREAAAPGANLQAGVKYVVPGKYLILTGGIDYRNTEIDPDDSGSDVRGSRAGFILEAVYGWQLSSVLELQTIGNYTTLGDSLWVRGRLKHLISESVKAGRLLAGIELVGQGSKDYSSYAAGVVLELKKDKSSYLISLGGRKNESIPDSVYMAIEFYRRF